MTKRVRGRDGPFNVIRVDNPGGIERNQIIGDHTALGKVMERSEYRVVLQACGNHMITGGQHPLNGKVEGIGGIGRKNDALPHPHSQKSGPPFPGHRPPVGLPPSRRHSFHDRVIRPCGGNGPPWFRAFASVWERWWRHCQGKSFGYPVQALGFGRSRPHAGYSDGVHREKEPRVSYRQRRVCRQSCGIYDAHHRSAF